MVVARETITTSNPKVYARMPAEKKVSLRIHTSSHPGGPAHAPRMPRPASDPQPPPPVASNSCPRKYGCGLSCPKAAVSFSDLRTTSDQEERQDLLETEAEKIWGSWQTRMDLGRVKGNIEGAPRLTAK